MTGSLRSIAFSNAALLVCGLLVFFVTAACLCGTNTQLFLAVMLIDGAAAFAWILGATAMGAIILDNLRLDPNPRLFLATAAGLGLGVFSLLGLCLGLIGWLNRPVAIGFFIIPVIAWLLIHHAKLHRPNLRPWLTAPAGSGWLWLIPVVSITIALVSASYLPGILWKPLDPHPYDVTGYHLLVPREWYEAGRIVPLEHNVYSYFEMNVEVQFLLLMHAMGGPWAAMYACQFLCVGYSGLLVVTMMGAGKGTCENRGQTSAFSSRLAAALISTVPWIIMLAGVAYVESALMLYTALAIAWAIQAIRPAGHLTKSMILTGVLAGFACGVKITAVPMLLLAVPAAALIVLIFRRPKEFTVKRSATACIAALLAGSLIVSPWLIRNFAWSGNPMFPVGMKVLGQDHFNDIQVKRFHDAHSPRPQQQSPSARLTILWRDILTHWQFGYIIFPLGAMACALGWKDRQAWLILIAGFFVLIVWIGFTHLLPRFLVMLLPIAAIAISRLRWGRAWPAGVVLVSVAAGLGWSRVIRELRRQPQIIGQLDTEFMLQDSKPLKDARDRGMQIGMIGDAQAFLYPIPLKQMHYRAVFNLHTGTQDPIQAWVGPDPIGNPNWLLVINPAEIQRLHETYYGIPAAPPEWDAHGDTPFIIRGDELKKIVSQPR